MTTTIEKAANYCKRHDRLMEYDSVNKKYYCEVCSEACADNCGVWRCPSCKRLTQESCFHHTCNKCYQTSATLLLDKVLQEIEQLKYDTPTGVYAVSYNDLKEIILKLKK